MTSEEWAELCRLKNGVEIRECPDWTGKESTIANVLFVDGQEVWRDDPEHYNLHPIEDLTLWRDLADFVWCIKSLAAERDAAREALAAFAAEHRVTLSVQFKEDHESNLSYLKDTVELCAKYASTVTQLFPTDELENLRCLFLVDLEILDRDLVLPVISRMPKVRTVNKAAKR